MKIKRVIYTSLAACLIFVAHTTFLKTGKAEDQYIVKTSDLSQHPVYSGYKFNNAENVVNLGVQPLYSPTGFITEVMKRDTVLRKDLSALGIKAGFYPFLKGSDVNHFLRSGDIDIGIGGDMPAVTAAATMDIVVPALIQQGFTSVVANRFMLIRELRGKKIGYAIGSNAHYALLKALSTVRLSEGQVKLIPMEVNEMPEALQSGEITAFSAWEPTPAITLIKYPENVVIHRYLSSGYIYFTKAFSDKYPEIVRQIIAAEVRALLWMQRSGKNLLSASEWALQAAENLTSQKLKLTIEQNTALARNDILGITSPPIIPQSDLRQNGPLQTEFEFLKTLNKIPASTNWEKVQNSFDFQVMIDVITHSKKYKLNEFDYDFE
jgi:NitT/TauT family transport system substrate-binding protein